MQISAFKLEHFFSRWEFAVPIMLGSSDAESHTMSELLALADAECREWLETLRLGYTEVQGHPRLRRAIASLYENVSAEQVVVFAGAQEAIFAFMNSTLEAGEHAVTLTPGYQSLYEVARSIGAQVTLLPLRHENGWRLEMAALESSWRPRTRVVATNYPHSPTGAHLDASTFRSLVGTTGDRGAWFLSDEVYRFAEFRDADRLPAAVDLHVRGVSLGVMSKAFGLAGLRIGWIASRDRTLLDKLMSFKHYLTICNSAASEVLATIALRARNAILERNRRIVLANLARLDAFFEHRGDLFEWVRPSAGTVGFPRLRSPVPIDVFAESLARGEGVLVLPGSVFDHPGSHFRIGFARRNLPDALGGLERFIEHNKDWLAGK